MTRTVDPFDELATMFLSPPAREQARPTNPHAMSRPSTTTSNTSRVPKRHTAPTMELLVVGHLPVRAGLWLTPYADAVARERGPTALLRLDGDEPTLQVLRAQGSVAAPPHGTGLGDALNAFSGAIDHWIVRTSGAHTPVDLLAAGVDRLTILSSGDEAAVVAAYQIVKELSQQAAETDATVPTVGLAIVGCERDVAEEIIDRLNRTTVSFLGVEVQLAMCLSRMDAGVKSSCYAQLAGQACPLPADAVAVIQHAAAGATNDAAPSAVIGRVHAERNHSNGMAAEDLLRRPFAQPAARSIPNAPPEAVVPPVKAPVSAPPIPAAAPIKLAPKPSTNVEAKQMRQPHEPSERGRPIGLGQHSAGLTVLPMRMPGHESVELAVDSAGRLHMLGREASLRELNIVEHWAISHREILAMACSQFATKAAADVVCHVFTDQPATLADLHGTGLRLHVLAPVSMGGQTTWYCAPLNAG